MNWQTVKISDVANQIRGVSYSAGDVIDKLQKGYIGLLRANNITDKGLTFVDLQYVPESKVSDTQVLRKNDILIAASSGSLSIVGKAGKFVGENNCTFGAFCKVIRPSSEVDPNYFANYFQTNVYRKTISSLAAGANINNLRNEHIDDLQLPLPPLSEQKRIAAILDKAGELKRKREAAISKLDQLAQSIFVEMFGDVESNEKQLPIKSLKDVCLRVTDGTHQAPKWANEGIPFLFISNIVNGEILLATNKYISDETYNELTKRCPIEIGDVLYTTVGSYGNVAIVKTTEKFCFQRHIAHIKPNHDLVKAAFISAMLYSKSVRQQVDRVAKGVAQKTVNLSDLSNIWVFCPPLALQEEFVNRISKLEKLKADSIAAHAKQNNLFTSLQHQAFAGQL